MILSGKELSDRLKASMAAEVAGFPAKYGRVPHLAVILVGDDPASVTYVRSKAKASEFIGIRNTTITLPAETSQEALLQEIAKLNADEGVKHRSWPFQAAPGRGREMRALPGEQITLCSCLALHSPLAKNPH